MKKRVSFYTLGCKLNFAETSALSRKFTEFGYEVTPWNSEADIIVINTCSVTSLAEKKGRNIIARAKRTNPNAVVIATGCYAQLRPDELRNLDGIDMVIDNKHKSHILEILDNSKDIKPAKSYKDLKEFQHAWSSDDRTRTFLKIQDGCDYFCAYCTIPMARGLSRSPQIKEIIEEAEAIAQSETKEIILTGVNIGDFGRKNGETLLELLKKLIKIKGIKRLRLGSIEPNLLQDEIIELVANSNIIMPHFHIPLQSGSNEVLKSMRRRYTTELFAQKVHIIKKMIPDACIAADIIVGVPGETGSHHKQAMEFVQNTGISYLHVFTYSERPGTLASKMDGKISPEEKNRRSIEMHKIGEECKTKFIEDNIGQIKPVLFEKQTKNNNFYGFTDNYIRVKTNNHKTLANQILETKLIESDEEGNVTGEIDYGNTSKH